MHCHVINIINVIIITELLRKLFSPETRAADGEPRAAGRPSSPRRHLGDDGRQGGPVGEALRDVDGVQQVEDGNMAADRRVRA